MTENVPAPSAPSPAPAPRAPRPRRRLGWVWAVAAVVVALAAGVFLGWGIGRSSATTTASTPAGTSAAQEVSACDAITVSNEVLPAVVTVSAVGSAGGGTGTGEIISTDGYIVTNNHVISAAVNGGKISVLTSGGVDSPAQLVGRDPRSDLAVLKVTASSSLPTVPWGDSAKVVVGQPVVALGAPLGLSGTVTSGIVSALGRTVPVPGDDGQTAILANSIQTDASINPGNSGGALVTCAGDLIGINSAIATVPNSAGQSGGGSVGIGFAIPSDFAHTIVDQIIATGHVTYPYFGISVAPIPPAAAEKLKVSDGLYVISVVAGGPSAAAGLQEGDVITQIDGKPAANADVLIQTVMTTKAGQKVDVTYVRGGETKTTAVTLETPPS
ncbi:S1C family serine protease [Leifsonia shinshuensis]|uniref:PDZ domain-containing protein n=1 Tax=Leifsonia shinshuensis TaxID=150026 RepID=A0A7G6YFR4_9MICO|nr:trypsin-like peptidase domain-containing protein [Leifsonia shinshuensis]QNE37329.1 PDZ domain-containing protein [Leifsonia shinshuensis]